MSLDVSNNVFQHYSTDPATYLNALKQESGSTGGAGGSTLQDLIQEVGQMLQQLQNGGGGAGAPSGDTATTPRAAAAPASTGGAPSGAGQMTAQNASGVLAAYMDSNNISSEDPDAMYKLAENANGSTPPTVQQAAKFMLANPDTYQSIESHDSPGTDGNSGIGNFQWAAQGGLGAAGNMPGATAGAMPTPGGMPATTGLPLSTSGTPAATTAPAAQPGTTGDLVNDGKPLQQADEGQALSNFNQQDPAAFQAFQNALSHGDGNSACHILADAVSSGKVSQTTGAALGAQIQQTANAHGGGKINGDASNALKSALGGEDVLAPGKTRGAIAFENLTGIKTGSILGVNTQ